jgi:FolB domain-containing protein
LPAEDRLLVRNLLVRGIVGLNDWEREKKQDILINLDIGIDARAAGESDDMSDSINYRTITKAVLEHVETSSHHLVEALATELARIAVVDHHAAWVTVRVEKPGALRFAESVGIEITRRRADFE